IFNAIIVHLQHRGSNRHGIQIVQFDCILEANDYTNIMENWNRALFLSSCGKQVFETAWELITPDPLQMVPWATLQEKFTLHYAP
ncbi:hypothetical protein E2320_011865, partial [Naja naja]